MALQWVDEARACSFTGHRPDRLGVVDRKDPAAQTIIEALAQNITRLYYEDKVTHFFTGMALGVDTWCAEQVLYLRQFKPEVRLHCVLPCYGQDESWSKVDRLRYREILNRADEIFYLNGPYFRGCMQERNRYLVDRAGTLLAVYDGRPGGGTSYTVDYAKKRRRRILLVPP